MKLFIYAVLIVGMVFTLTGCAETEDQVDVKGLGPQTPCQRAIARGETWACDGSF